MLENDKSEVYDRLYIKTIRREVNYQSQDNPVYYLVTLIQEVVYLFM